jgi:hypothetical protein
MASTTSGSAGAVTGGTAASRARRDEPLRLAQTFTGPASCSRWRTPKTAFLRATWPTSAGPARLFAQRTIDRATNGCSSWTCRGLSRGCRRCSKGCIKPLNWATIWGPWQFCRASALSWRHIHVALWEVDCARVSTGPRPSSQTSKSPATMSPGYANASSPCYQATVSTALTLSTTHSPLATRRCPWANVTRRCGHPVVDAVDDHETRWISPLSRAIRRLHEIGCEIVASRCLHGPRQRPWPTLAKILEDTYQPCLPGGRRAPQRHADCA